MHLPTNTLINIKRVTFFWNKDFFAFDVLGGKGGMKIEDMVGVEDVIYRAHYLVGWGVFDGFAEVEGAWGRFSK